MVVSRYPEELAKYKMLSHEQGRKNRKRYIFFVFVFCINIFMLLIKSFYLKLVFFIKIDKT